MGGWEWHPRMRLAACQEKSVGILAAGPTVGRHLITRLSALLLDAPGLGSCRHLGGLPPPFVMGLACAERSGSQQYPP